MTDDLDVERDDLLVMLRRIRLETDVQLSDAGRQLVMTMTEIVSAMQDAFFLLGTSIAAALWNGSRTREEWNRAEFEYRYAMQRQRKARRVRRG